MYPNQQPNQDQPGSAPSTPPSSPPPEVDPQAYPQAAPPTYPGVPSPELPPAPRPLTPREEYDNYAHEPKPTYEIDYLDKIAPPPPKPKFFSGSFAKVLIGIIALLVVVGGVVLALPVAKSKTSDLETAASTYDSLLLVAQFQQKYIKSKDLSSTNTNYQVWLTNASRDSYDLLAKAGVTRGKIGQSKITEAKALNTDLTGKFEDARLNGTLDRVYAREMSFQTKLLLVQLSTINKTSEAKLYREWAKDATNNLTPIQKSFNDFNESAL